MLALVITFSGNPESRDTSTPNLTMNSSTIISRIHPTNSNGLRRLFQLLKIILTGIYNDIYSTVDACPNACEMWKAIERLKQGESINFLLQLQLEWQRFVTLVKQSQELKTVSYHKLYDILKQHQNEVNGIRVERLARTANPLALVAQQQPVYHPQKHPNHYTQNSSTRSQQAATRNRGKAIVNSPSPTYDQEPKIVVEDDALSKEKKIDKFMALISLSFKKIYKPTNNNLKTSSNTNRVHHDNTLRINRGTGYDNQRAVNVAGARENVGTQVVQQSGIQCYNYKEYRHVAKECQKPKWAKDAAYHKDKMLLCKNWKHIICTWHKFKRLLQMLLTILDSSLILNHCEKVQNDDDNYNVFANDKELPVQPESVNDTYLEEQGDTTITIDSLDMSTNEETIDQDDDDDLARECNLLAFLIDKLKCEIDDSKNHNKFLESSNKALVNKLKGEIEDFKTKNKSLESLNNHFKEAHSKLSKTNQLMFKDLKKFQAELDRYHDVNYASKVEINCAKAKDDLVSYKMESQKSFNEYTRKINDLNQTILEIKKELFAHQETISIMSQEKEAQNKFYKTREDKEIEKYLKKAQRANPRLYDIGCYNDNLALMLAPESDETIRLAHESRSKLSDLIKPFDYKNLNNLYDLFVPQREKSPEQRYFSERSKMSHTPVKNENSKESFNKQTTLLEKRMDESIPEYYYADHMNAILGVYKNLDEFTDLQCDYMDQVVKCERLEKELSKRTDNVHNKSFNELSKRFFELEQHSITLELALQQCQEQIKNDKAFKENQSKVFLKERKHYFEIQDLKAQLQDKGIAISELKKLIEKLKGKSMETKFEKPSVIRQPNACQRQPVLGKPATFLDSLVKTDFSKSKSVTTNNVSNDFLKPVTTQILPQNMKSILKNTNAIAPGMYKMHTRPNQTRTPQLPQDIRKTNKRVSFSTGLISTTSVSRPQLKSNRLEDRVMHNNSEGKKQQVEDHHRNFKFSNNKTSVTACNDSLNDKTPNVNFVCVTCGKCVLNDNHDMCVLYYTNGVNSRPKMPMDVPISTREPKRTVNQYFATSLKRIVASESTNLEAKLGSNMSRLLVEIILFIIDSGCSKHMTGNLKLLSNFVEKFLGTVKFGNDQIALILGYGDLVQGNITIKRVYYVEGLNHNLFSVGQFCDADLEVAFRKSTCYVRDLKGNDLLTGSYGSDLYSITLQDTTPNPICLMAKTTSSQACLWHHRLSHLNFDFINLLDGENLDKMKEKGDACIFVGYSTQSRAYQAYNKRTRLIVETIHVNFDELLQMALDHVSSDPVPQCPTTALEHDNLSPGPQSQENVPHSAETVTTSNELDLLFSLMFDELLNGTTQVVSKSSAVTATDTPNQRQQQHTTPSTSTTVAADAPLFNIQTTLKTTSQAPTITANENIIQAETNKEYAQVDSSNMHTFYQRHPSKHRWTKDHPLEQVIGNPSQSIRTRRQLEIDGEMCMFPLTVSQTEPKNIKEAMDDSTWIEAMQEELYQFD
ncbi:retrovirus-related pol polyprotein from transposon TNT 1-94 [Tanacetum coccineum]